MTAAIKRSRCEGTDIKEDGIKIAWSAFAKAVHEAVRFPEAVCDVKLTVAAKRFIFFKTPKSGFLQFDSCGKNGVEWCRETWTGTKSDEKLTARITRSIVI